MVELTLYLFRIRDAISGKWRTTRHRLTADEARDRYGEGNYKLLDWSREVRRFESDKLTGGHLASGADLALQKLPADPRAEAQWQK